MYKLVHTYVCIYNPPKYKKKFTDTGVCLSGLSHYRISSRAERNNNKNQNSRNRELTKHMKKTRKYKKKTYVRAHDEIIT